VCHTPLPLSIIFKAGPASISGEGGLQGELDGGIDGGLEGGIAGAESRATVTAQKVGDSPISCELDALRTQAVCDAVMQAIKQNGAEIEIGDILGWA